MLEVSLQSREVRLKDVLSRSSQINADELAQEFQLSAEEQNLLFQALQLKAQAAVESIRRVLGEKPEVSAEEIDAEIQVVRKQRRNADRA